jgi:hypothetical protein
VDRYNRRAASYEENWKGDHDDAMRCVELEEVIALGLTVYNLINRMDEIWRLAVHKKKVAYSPKVDKLITKALRDWLRGCKILAKIIKKVEGLGYEVTGAEEFRLACREAEGILTPDEAFFDGEKLQGLEAAALKSHRAGRTKTLRSLSD